MPALMVDLRNRNLNDLDSKTNVPDEYKKKPIKS